MSQPTEPGVADVVIERGGPIMTIVLDRPQLKNALTVEMIAAINGAVREASLDDVTRVVVIRSSGDDFCSGIDLVESNSPANLGSAPDKPRTGHLQRRLGTGAHEMITTLSTAQVPVVAAVRGWAVGVGNMLALSADVTIAAPSARFWVPFVTKGFTPDSGNTWLLPRLVGLARAKEMVLRGQPVDGELAAAWGLVSRCVPDDELDDAIAAVADEFASSATVAVGLTRQLLHQNLSGTLLEAMHNEAIHEELAVRSDDFKEGMRAFAQKRPPDYTGR